MATTTLRVTNIMTQDGAPASGVHPTDNSPDTSLATVGYVNTKISGVGELDTNISALQGKITNLQNQLNNIQSTALTRAQYGALKDQLTSDINQIVAAGDNAASQAIKNLQDQLRQANANITTLNNRNSILEARVTQLENEKITLTNTISDLNNQLRDAQAGSGNSEALTAAQEQVRTLKAEIQTKDAKIAELTLNVKQLQADLKAALERANGGQQQPGSSGTGQQPTGDGGFKGTTVGGVEFV